MKRDTRVAINVSCLVGLMAAATFLPWGKVTAEAAADDFFVGNEITGGALSLFGSKVTVPISGWVGSIRWFGVELANWLPLLAIVSIAAIAWLRATKVTMSPRAVMAAITLYAFLHLGTAFTTIQKAEGASIGIGLVLAIVTTVLTFLALFPLDRTLLEQGVE